MIRKTLFIAAIAFSISSVAQTVNIPDVSFKAYLVGNQSINTNADNEIQVSEAQAFTGFINCSNENILDLTGIEAFTSLTQLNCGDNQLASLDISSNTALILLGCHNNKLTKLNVKNGNNVNFTNLKANNNPNLTCIEVDNPTFSTSTWTGGNFEFDGQSTFSESCGTLGIEQPLDNKAVIYPNPTTGIFHLSNSYNITLTDLTGKTIVAQEESNFMDISYLPTGIYFITLINEVGQLVHRSKITKN